MTYHGDPWSAVLLAGLYGALKAWEWWDGRGDDDRDAGLEAARAAYVAGEIGEAEFERRAALAIDPENDRIRETIEEIGGVGPATSAEVAVEFGSLEELRRVDQEELADRVHGVGPSTADAIVARVRS